MSSSEQLRRALRDARASRQILLIAGDTHDWFFAKNGKPHRLREFLTLEALTLGLGTVAYRRGTRPTEICPPDATPSAWIGPRLTELWSNAVRTGDSQSAEILGPERILPGLLNLFDLPDAEPLLILIEGVENLLPDTNGPVSHPTDLDQLDLLQRLITHPSYDEGVGLLVLAEHASQVHARLRGSPGVTVVELPGPSPLERIRLLEIIRPTGVPRDWYSQVGDASSGLLLDDLRVLDQLSAAEGNTLDLETVTKRKSQVLRRRCRHIELLEPTLALDEVVGLDHLKVFLEGYRLAQLRLRGMLLAGPPGTGKTYFTRALAASLGLPVVKLNLIDSSYIGDKERQIRAALRTIDQLAPAVVFFDEVDAHFQSRHGGPNGDSGTTERVQAEFMEWSGDLARTSQITLIGTTNRPDRIDDALRSRFPVTIPVLHPTPPELVNLIPSIANQLGVELDPSIDLDSVVRHPNLAAVSARQLGALLEAAATKVARPAGRRWPVDSKSLRLATDALSKPSPEAELWTLLALEQCTDRSLLSWWDGQRRRIGTEVPFFAREVTDPDGRINDEALQLRISQMNRQTVR